MFQSQSHGDTQEQGSCLFSTLTASLRLSSLVCGGLERSAARVSLDRANRNRFLSRSPFAQAVRYRSTHLPKFLPCHLLLFSLADYKNTWHIAVTGSYDWLCNCLRYDFMDLSSISFIFVSPDRVHLWNAVHLRFSRPVVPECPKTKIYIYDIFR
jgi:hypothetical protein